MGSEMCIRDRKTYEYLISIENRHNNLLDSIRETQLYLLRNYLDSEVVKSRGVNEAIFIKNYVSLINTLDNKILKEELLSILDNYLRERGVNVGTLADILAVATALTLT